MKKIFYFIASAIVALGAVACQNDINEGVTPESEGFSINVTIADQTRVALGDLDEDTKQRKLTFTEGDVLVVREDSQRGTNYLFTYTKNEGDVYTFTCEQEGVSKLVGTNPYICYQGGLHEQADDLTIYGTICNTAAEDISGIGMYASPYEFDQTGKFGEEGYTVILRTCPLLKFTANEPVTFSCYDEDNNIEGYLFFTADGWASEYTTKNTGEIYLPIMHSNSEEYKVTVTTESGFNKSFTKEFELGKIYNLGTIEASAPEIVEGWYLVTDAAELAVGDQVIIAAKNSNVAMSTTQNTNNRGQAAVTKDTSNNSLTFNSAVQEFTLKAGTTNDTWAFYTGSGYLYAASSSSNHLKTQTTNNANSSWTISITAAGVATVKATGTNTKNWMRYNSTNSLFACYSSGQQDICIYKFASSDTREVQNISFPEAEYTVTIGEEFDAPTVSGAATTVTYSSDNEDIATVDENTGAVTLKGQTGYVTITATAAESNDYKSATASYTLNVKSVSLDGTGEGNKESPYDVTRACAVIDEANGTVVENVYVKGIITTDPISFDSKYNSCTYYISVDGTTTKKLQVYSGKNLDNKNFESPYQLHAGDEVVVYGSIKKYNTTYEFNYNNYIVSMNCEHTDLDQTISFINKPTEVEVDGTVTVSASAYTPITYTSSDTTVATVNATTGAVTGVKEGTATITATAEAKYGYKSVSTSYEITVVKAGEIEVVGGGKADFATITSTNTSYVTGKTTAGWNYKNCAILQGGNSDSSPTFKMIGETSNRALCMNGKTSAVGTVTSPTLNNGCGTLTFNYGLPFSDTKIKFKVEIKQNGNVVKTITVDKSSATQKTKYSHSEEINVAGDFQIVFTNLSPSSSTSNKDRTAIWDVVWTGYAN